ncbi:MAG: hypothetical protein IPI06_12935 [Gammaproteobacteria bacterium]|nr:hypothetical protein [Gammaproteobacteria bacterium]
MKEKSGSAFVACAAVLVIICTACTRQAPPEQHAATAAEKPGPCDLLTPGQVQTVLPGASAGMTTHSGASLVEGIDAYQCSYVNPTGEVLTVILNVARTPDRLAEIAPGSAVRENRRRVDIAQEGWLSTSADEVKIKAVKGLTVFDIDLLATDASDREAQLMELARTLAVRIQ